MQSSMLSCVRVVVDWFGYASSPSTSVHLLSPGYRFRFAFCASPSGSAVASLSLCCQYDLAVSGSSTFHDERGARAVLHAEWQIRQGLPGVCGDGVLETSRGVRLAAEKQKFVCGLLH